MTTNIASRFPQQNQALNGFGRSLRIRSLLIAINEYGFRDLVPNASPYSANGNLARVNTPSGPAMRNTSSFQINVNANFGSQTFSRVAIFTLYSLSGIATISSGAATGSGNSSQWRIETSGEMSLLKANVAGIGTSSGAGIVSGNTYVCGVTYDGANVEFFINGRSVGRATNAQTFANDGGATLFSQPAGGEAMNGSIGMHIEMPPQPAGVMRAMTANPFQIFAIGGMNPEMAAMLASTVATTSITSALAWTEGDETMSLAGAMTNRIAVAWTEAGDTTALNAVISNRASVSWTEGNETSSVLVVVTNRGALTWSEEVDIAAITGTVQEPAAASISAAMAWTEAGDLTESMTQIVNRGFIASMDQDDSWQLAAISALPPGSDYPQLNLYTIMRAPQINLTASLGVPVNLTGNLL